MCFIRKKLALLEFFNCHIQIASNQAIGKEQEFLFDINLSVYINLNAVLGVYR
jgi:hypothetical protein